MTDFLAMGGYAAFVWPSYALAALVLLGLLIASLKGLRDAEATVKALESARPARRRSRPTAKPETDSAPDLPGKASEG
jgi:heme exporter protein D